jgi:prophage antirepressor-like protein
MTDNIHTTQTDPTGRKRGDRKINSNAPEGDVAQGTSQLDQLLIAEEILQGPNHAIVPVPFDFQGKAVRTITKGDDIWFVATDVCALLEHSNPRMAIGGLDDDQRGVSIVSTAGGPQRANVVSESGLFSLIFMSRRPEAKTFRRWVTGVVLPAIRRTGKFDIMGDRGQISAARYQTENDNGVTVSLPGPGRYLVGLFPDGEQRIEPLYFSDAISALTTLDCRSIAYSHLTAVSLWEKLQHLRLRKGDVKVGFTMEKLNATMLAGAELARQILYTYDEPDLIPRPAAKAVTECT